ncbi:MAG TPA: carboxypeptidase-like regulatory domain-containing protein [Thermoanaerobaculia bacterium]
MRLRGRAAKALLVMLALRAAAPAEAGGWRIAVRGADLTRAADPVESAGVVLVDLAALAPALRLAVRVDGPEIAIRDAEDREWRGAPGASLLAAPGRTMHLERPLRLDGRSIRVPLAAAAELAGLTLRLEPSAKRADLTQAEASGPALSAPGGWQAISLPKQPAPLAPHAESRPAAGRLDGTHLDHARESLRFGLGLGHVHGADWGSEIAATGSVRGLETRLAGFLTAGPAGLELYSGHAALSDPESGWGAEAGDLFSEIWGSAQGFRLQRGSSGLSLYLPDPHSGSRDLVLALQGEAGAGERVAIAGELATDGSWLLRGRMRREPLTLFGYYRETAGAGLGLSASLDLVRGISLQGGWSRSGEGDAAIEWSHASLRLPIRRDLDLTVESAGADGAFGRSRSDALILGLPAGPVILRARYQRRQTEVFARGPLRPFRSEQRELLAVASYTAGPRFHLELQSTGRWSEAGIAEPWQQLAATWRITPRTSVQLVTVSSNAPFSDPLRLRLNQELPRGFTFFAEYGRTPSFQAETGAAGLQDGARIKVMVRKSWEISTPARGALVEGQVGEGAGGALAGVPVHLGPYRAVTDGRGRYTFRNVPRGRYEVRVPDEALPAGYSGVPPRSLEVQDRSRETLDLAVLALCELRGWVYVDRDGDGHRDPDEGIAGVALRLGKQATASGADGAFGFHNLRPGAYDLRIDVDRLRPGLAVTVPSRMSVGLPPGRSLDGIELRLAERRRGIVFQELR